jgi:hypothetical protein
MNGIGGTVTVYETVYCPGAGPILEKEETPNDCPKPEGTIKPRYAQARDMENFI